MITSVLNRTPHLTGSRIRTSQALLLTSRSAGHSGCRGGPRECTGWPLDSTTAFTAEVGTLWMDPINRAAQDNRVNEENFHSCQLDWSLSMHRIEVHIHLSVSVP